MGQFLARPHKAGALGLLCRQVRAPQTKGRVSLREGGGLRRRSLGFARREARRGGVGFLFYSGVKFTEHTMNCFKVAFSTQCCATIACIWFQNIFITLEGHLVRGGFEIVSSEVYDITPQLCPNLYLQSGPLGSSCCFCVNGFQWGTHGELPSDPT